MVRYTEQDDCLGDVYKGQRVKFGLFFTHGLEDHNWVVGFAHNNGMVYVPEGTVLIDQEGVQYRLHFEKNKDGTNLAHLQGNQERWGMESETTINLKGILEARFNPVEKPVFTIKEVGKDKSPEPETPEKPSLLRRILRKTG